MAGTHHIAITDAQIKRIQPDGTDRIYRDRDLVGFGYRVKPNGTASFIVDARIAGGKARRKTLRAQNAKAARGEAMVILGNWKGGEDTVAIERQQRRDALPTLQEILDAYIAHRDLKPRTATEYQLLLTTHLKCWADVSIDQIKPGMVKMLHQRIESPSRANAAMRVLSALWNFAWADNIDDITGDSRLTGKNPVSVLSGLRQWHVVKPKQRHLSVSQFSRWYAAVNALKGERVTSKHALVKDLFLFLVLTGIRLNEALKLSDKTVDLDAATFTLLDTKNRSDFTLPASKPALDILKRRHGNGLLFPIDRGSMRRYITIIEGETGLRITPHDLRRTFATHAHDIGIDKRIVGELLNHRTGRDVTRDYITRSPEPYRKYVQRIGEHIEGLMR